MQTGADLYAEFTNRLTDASSTLNHIDRFAKSGEKAVTGGIDLLALELGKLVAHQGMMAI
jgi:hypothetical protein